MTWSCGLLDLDVRAALDLAIMIEEDAALRYEALAALVAGEHGGAGSVFLELAASERRHCAELEARRDALRGAGWESRIEVSVLDAPAAEHPEADEGAPPRTARDALEVALAAELRAEAFYRNALPRLADAGALALFEELAGEEAEHVALLQRRVAALGPAAPTRLDAGPLPDPPPAPPLDLDPDLAALERVLPLFDAATQAVARGVLVQGLEPEQVAAALGVSRRAVARKLTRFVDHARRYLAAGIGRPALTH